MNINLIFEWVTKIYKKPKELEGYTEEEQELINILKENEFRSIFLDGVFGSGKTTTVNRILDFLKVHEYTKKEKWKRKFFRKNKILKLNFYEEYNHDSWYKYLYFKLFYVNKVMMVIIHVILSLIFSCVITFLYQNINHPHQNINHPQFSTFLFFFLIILIVISVLRAPFLIENILKIKSIDFYYKAIERQLKKISYVVIDDFDRVNDEEMYQQIKLISYIYTNYIGEIDLNSKGNLKLLILGDYTNVGNCEKTKKIYLEQIDKYIHVDFPIYPKNNLQFQYFIEKIELYINKRLSELNYKIKSKEEIKIESKKVKLQDFFIEKYKEYNDLLVGDSPNITWRSVHKTIKLSYRLIDKIINYFNYSLFYKYIYKDENGNMLPAFVVDNEEVCASIIFSGINWLQIFLSSCSNYKEMKENISNLIDKKKQLGMLIDEGNVGNISSLPFNISIKKNKIQFIDFENIVKKFCEINADDKYLPLLLMSRVLWIPFSYGFNGFKNQSDKDGIDITKNFVFKKLESSNVSKFDRKFLNNLLTSFMFMNLEYTLHIDINYFNENKLLLESIMKENKDKNFIEIIEFLNSISNFVWKYYKEMGLQSSSKPYSGDKQINTLFTSNCIYNFTNIILCILEYMQENEKEWFDENQNNIIEYLELYSIDNKGIKITSKQKIKFDEVFDRIKKGKISFNNELLVDNEFLTDFPFI